LCLDSLWAFLTGGLADENACMISVLHSTGALITFAGTSELIAALINIDEVDVAVCSLLVLVTISLVTIRGAATAMVNALVLFAFIAALVTNDVLLAATAGALGVFGARGLVVFGFTSPLVTSPVLIFLLFL